MFNNLKNRIRILKDSILVLNNLDYRLKSFSAKELMKSRMLFSSDKGISDSAYADHRLVVSLTTHGKRINTVYQAVESIFSQTIRPNIVTLYLSDKEFNEDSIPESLKKQRDRGLRIVFTKDVRSYTKLVPALKDYPEEIILTIDDDYIYPFDMVEQLLNAYKRHPKAVCCMFSRVMKENSKGVLTYDSFPMNFIAEEEVSLSFLAEGFGGVLYPPHSLHVDVCNEALFQKLAPFADDVWFKAMEILAGTPVCQVSNDRGWFLDMISEETVQDDSLKRKNVWQNKNDEQIKAVFNHYGIKGKLG